MRYGFSSRKSHVFESLRSLCAWHMPSNGCLFQNARSSVDRSSTLDASSSSRRGDICVLRLRHHRGDDVASLITNSRIGGHTHTKEEYILSFASKFPWVRLADRIGGFSWVWTPCKFCPKADFVDYPGCASRGSVGCNKFYRAGRQVLPRCDKLRIVFHILYRIRSGSVEINDVI